MKTVFYGGSAIALAAMSGAPAMAQDVARNDDSDTIRVEQQLLTPAAGMLNDHMHESGEVMIGLRFVRRVDSGTNQSGTSEISDDQIFAAGFTARTQRMEMDMLMLDLMVAPSDDITLMVMPHYMWHRMDMRGIDPANTGMSEGGHGEGGHGEGGHGESGHGGHGHGGIPFGMIASHETHGFGDTLVSASYRLAKGPQLRAHATLGIWVPTGAVDRTNGDGTFVHYGMQPGSGTWDVEPAVTLAGKAGMMGWGAQASYRWRTENANASGFAFGDVARATGWVSYRLGSDFGATMRAEYQHEGQIVKHYNGPHNHSAPPDRQANYGGDTVQAGLGVNWAMPLGQSHRPQLGAEILLPVYQNLNGIQAPRKWSLALSLAQTF